MSTNLKRGPIDGLPDSLLEDCLLDMGRRGSGKSFLFRVAMERALTKRMRAGWIDATGVGWGITVEGSDDNLKKPAGPGYEVVVFGGDHGKIPLAPTMGAALGNQLAKATFSWVLDISKFPSKRSRVQFMRDFLDAIYEGCAEPLILFVDEADLWAPQIILDRHGAAAELLGIMDDIIRRGRVKGLSLWMSTQRPAAISKQVISQVEALITFKLVMPHDLDAAMLWIEDHLDKAQAKEIRVKLPSLQVGEAIVYLTDPKISIVQRQFPLIQTLDTFGRPEKGSKGPSDKQMAAIDVEAIRAHLGEIETELKANDPASLKREIADLQKQLKAKPSAAPIAGKPSEVDTARLRAEGYNAGWAAALKETKKAHQVTVKGFDDVRDTLNRIASLAHAASSRIPVPELVVTTHPPLSNMPPATAKALEQVVKVAAKQMRQTAPAEGLTKSQQRVLDSAAWWAAVGLGSVTRVQLAAGARYAIGGNFDSLVSSLMSAGYLERPQPGLMGLTDEGRTAALSPDEPGSSTEIQQMVRETLNGPQTKVFDAALSAHPGSLTREALAEASGYAPGGNFDSLVSSLMSREFLHRPVKGQIAAAEWLFEVR